MPNLFSSFPNISSKPFWYALARLMGDEMKTESAKMGRELEESVVVIIARVKEYQAKYQ